MHVWSSQLDHELLEDGNNIPQVSVASRLSTGPSTGPDTGVHANSASMAAIEVHCLSYPSGEPAAGAQFTVSLWVWPLWIYALCHQGHSSPQAAPGQGLGMMGALEPVLSCPMQYSPISPAEMFTGLHCGLKLFLPNPSFSLSFHRAQACLML